MKEQKLFWVTYHNRAAGTYDMEKFRTMRGATARCRALCKLGFNARVEISYIPQGS